MANILSNTEDFSAGNWSPGSGLVVTTNTQAPPTFAGINATGADKVEDNSAVVVANLISNFITIAVDSSDWLFSIFVRKDSNITRFPNFVSQFSGGSGTLAGISLNTQTGAIADVSGGAFPPDASGSVDVDSLWWRVWWRKANDSSNNAVRIFIGAANTDTLGGGDVVDLVDFITAWGANITNTTSLQTYEPDPFYSFIGAPNPFFTTVGARRFGY